MNTSTPDPKKPWDYPAPPEMESLAEQKRALLVDGNPPRDPAVSELYHRLEREIESTDHFRDRRHAQQLSIHQAWKVKENGGFSVAALPHPEGGLALRISRQSTSEPLAYRWVASEEDVPRILTVLRGQTAPDQEQRLTAAFRRFGGIMRSAGCTSNEDFAAYTARVYEGLGVPDFRRNTLSPANRERVISVFEALADLPSHRKPATLDQLNGEIAIQAARVK